MDNQNKKLLSDLILIRKEVERLNDRKKIPVINYIGGLQHQESVSGELNLKGSRSAVFHFFVDFKENGAKHGDKSLILSIKNENTKEIKEDEIYKENNIIQQPAFGGFDFGDPNHKENNIIQQPAFGGFNFGDPNPLQKQPAFGGFNFGDPNPLQKQFDFGGFGGFGFAVGGGNDLGSKNLNLLFSKSMSEGKNKISVKNFLSCEIQTLYLIAEI